MGAMFLGKRASALLAVGALVGAGCGGSGDGGSTAGASVRAATTTSAATTTAVRPPAPPTRLRVVARRALPAPVQLPAVAALPGGTVLAVGGLNAGDASVADVVRVAPGTPK